MYIMRCFLFIFFISLSLFTFSQIPDSSLNIATQLPGKYYLKVNKKISALNDQLAKKSLKYLAKFQKQGQRLQRKLEKVYPELVLNNVSEKYINLSRKIKSRTSGATAKAIGEYNPYLDSLETSLNFLKQFNDEAKDPLKSFELLQNNLQASEKIKAFIAERKSQVKELLSEYTHLPPGIKNEYNKLNKTAYYYSSQVNEYKQMLKDPDKIEKKVLSIIRQLPAFQKFMKENSQLGNLFGIPANYASSESLQGLQTIDQVQQLVSSRIGSGPNVNQMLQQQVQSAQGELNKLKEKLNQFGGGSADIEAPDFKVNNQKTKTFLKRLEYGSNLQTTRGSYNFPTTTDIGVSVGYKLNNKNTIGIGASYKGGWGKDIRHINVTAEGMGLRSFFEFKIKKSFYTTGGLEYNYQQPFNSIQIKRTDAWQQSGLIGISKVIDVKSKVFKKTKLKLLWDFLSYQQIIRAQPLKFRIGYNF